MSTVSVTAGQTRDRTLTIDGRPVTVAAGTTIWDAARPSASTSRCCATASAWTRSASAGCASSTSAAASGRLLRPGLRGRHAGQTAAPGSSAAAHADRTAAGRPPVARRAPSDHHRRLRAGGPSPAATIYQRQGRRRAAPAAATTRRPVIAVDHNACILCDRCIRACDDIQCNDVIGRTGKGYTARIAFDLDDPMGESSCVSCGECMASCPTGALTNKPLGTFRSGRAARSTRSTASVPTAASAAR